MPEGAVGVVCDTLEVTSPTRHDASEVLRRLASGVARDERLTHLEVLPPRAGIRAPWPVWTAPALVDAWRSRGIDAPWSHQVENIGSRDLRAVIVESKKG